MDYVYELADWQKEMYELFPGRKAVIDMAVCCLIAKQNMLLIGPPGTAKTKLLETLVESITDSTVFYLQFHRAIRREDIVGMLDIKHLTETGEVRHNTKGFLPEAHYAVLDELLRGSPSATNSLLSILHPEERLLKLGNDTIFCPVETCFATSNYMDEPDEEALDALYERFAVIMYVQHSLTKAEELSIYMNQGISRSRFIDKKELRKLQRKAANIEVPIEVLEDVIKLREACSEVREQSIRSTSHVILIAKAMAALTGESKLNIDIVSHVAPYVFTRHQKETAQYIAKCVSLGV